MSKEFVILQLAFNLLMFLALVALAWRSRERRPAARPEPRRAGASAAPPLAAVPPAARARAPLAPHLDDLVQNAERRELAAEAALRQRLAQFKGRAAGA